jgi:hypothetical protein
MLYPYESWKSNKITESKLNAFENKCLGKILHINILDMGYYHCTPDMSMGAQTLPSTYTSVSIGK